LKTQNITSYRDHRGEVYPSWVKTENMVEFVEDRFSRSTKRVVRGFHGDNKSWKLCMCVYGSLQLSIWDIQNKKKHDFILDDKTKLQVLIPPFCLNAHQCLSDEGILHYKWSNPYSLEQQWSVKYDDPTINAIWPLKNVILSDRDQNSQSLDTLLQKLDNWQEWDVESQ